MIFTNFLLVITHCKFGKEMFTLSFTDTETWREITPATERSPWPGIRCSHFAAVYKDALYIFAGYSGKSYYSDIWRFHFGTSFQATTSSYFSMKQLKNGKIWLPKWLDPFLQGADSLRQFTMIQCMLLLVGIELGTLKTSSASISVIIFCIMSTNKQTKGTLRWIAIENPSFKTLPSISQHAAGVYKNFLVLYGGIFTADKGECLKYFVLFN